MNIYIYSDESGVFDKVHNDYFVFAGLIFLDKDERDIFSRKYARAERCVKVANGIPNDQELKASNITNRDKGKLFRSLNNVKKFGVIIHQQKLLDRIFMNKKDKQRYLDYAYKIAVKRALEELVHRGEIRTDEVEFISFFVDEHTTATNGMYELREGLEKELKTGTYNYKYSTYYPPLFPKMKSVNLQYCNSSKNRLVRASDIAANRLYYIARNQQFNTINQLKNFNVIKLP